MFRMRNKKDNLRMIRILHGTGVKRFVLKKQGDIHSLRTKKIELDTLFLSYDVGPKSDKTLRNKIDKPLVVYRFSGNAMKSITMLRT